VYQADKPYGFLIVCTVCTHFTPFFISLLSAELGFMIRTPLHKEGGMVVGYKVFAVASHDISVP